MLMYRKKDAAHNKTFDDPAQWPEHLIDLRKQLVGEEDDEIDRKTKDRDICKVSYLFPSNKKFPFLIFQQKYCKL